MAPTACPSSRRRPHTAVATAACDPRRARARDRVAHLSRDLPLIATPIVASHRRGVVPSQRPTARHPAAPRKGRVLHLDGHRALLTIRIQHSVRRDRRPQRSPSTSSDAARTIRPLSRNSSFGPGTSRPAESASCAISRESTPFSPGYSSGRDGVPPGLSRRRIRCHVSFMPTPSEAPSARLVYQCRSGTLERVHLRSGAAPPQSRCDVRHAQRGEDGEQAQDQGRAELRPRPASFRCRRRSPGPP